MCGIGGVVGTWHDRAGVIRQLESMIGTLAHRGPDGRGIHVEPGVGLAHARLSIIDQAGGAQPMRDDSGRLCLVFNGEIFNYVELRRELSAQGHVFRTHSDTEVILHLYRRHGNAFVRHLNGQFAIALWDGDRKTLVLARDRAGIRPLHLCRHSGRWWFGSEVKALLATLPHAPRLAADKLAAAFTYWSVPEPGTIYEGIECLPAGCMSEIDATGRRTTWRYWDWDFATPAQSRHPPWPDPSAAARELRALLEDSVRLQLRSDVPVAAYLSGGLDSSGIAALARRQSGAALHTFSINFDDPRYDETPYQRAMATHLGTRHRSFRCGTAAIGDAFPRFIRHAEAPVLRTAGVPLMLLADQVRARGFKVVLTGEGADEVFGGYDLFKEAKVRRFWARSPGSAWRPRLLERLYPYLGPGSFGSGALAAGFFGQDIGRVSSPVFSHLPRWRTSRRALALFSPDLRGALGGWDHEAHYAEHLPVQAAGWSALGRDQYIEAKSLLSGYLLAAQGDRAAMAASIEGRYPYLDHRLIDFAGRLPASWKLRRLDEKHILKLALMDLLPAEILKRPKQPYRAPDSSCFFRNGKPLDYVAEALSPSSLRSAGYFDPVAVRALLEKCQAGRATGISDNQAFVGVLSTMLLHGHSMLRAMPSACPHAVAGA